VKTALFSTVFSGVREGSDGNMGFLPAGQHPEKAEFPGEQMSILAILSGCIEFQSDPLHMMNRDGARM